MCHDILQMAMDCVWSRQCFQLSHVSANKNLSICSCIAHNLLTVKITLEQPEHMIQHLYTTNYISYNENTTHYSIVEI